MPNLNNLFHDIDPDTNLYDSTSIMLENSTYYSVKNAIEYFEYRNDYFSVISYNIRSFHANQDTFFSIFRSKISFPKIFVLCETWFSEDNCMDIPGYTAFHSIRSGRRSGGVSIYVQDFLSCTLIKDLSYVNSNIEICTISVAFKNITYYIIGIYRPQSDPISNFVSVLEPILNHPILNNKNCIILGDLNIDLLSDSNPCNIFISLMQSFRFLPCISKATRFPTSEIGNPSLLDHIWLNTLTGFESGILHDFTDYLPVFLSLPVLSQTNNFNDQTVKISFRLDNMANRESFQNDITEFNWNSIYNLDVDLFLEKFCTKLNLFYCKNFPLKEKILSPKKVLNPWCTPAIENLLKIKSNFFKLLKLRLISKDENNKFKNRVKKIIEKSKTNYYRKYFLKVRGDLRRTWDLIRSLSTLNTRRGVHQIVHMDREYTSPENISEIFFESKG